MATERQLKNLQAVFLILLAAMSLAAWLDYGREREVPSIDLRNIPDTIGLWRGANLAKSRDDQKRADQGDFVLNRYTSPHGSIYLVAIQERGDRHRVHSPLNCYTGSGWTLLEKKTVLLPGDIAVRRLLVNREQCYRLVYYWFTNGKTRSTGFLSHLLSYAGDILIGKKASAWVYFDVSADITDSVAATEAQLGHFVAGLEGLSLFDRPAREKAAL